MPVWKDVSQQHTKQSTKADGRSQNLAALPFIAEVGIELATQYCEGLLSAHGITVSRYHGIDVDVENRGSGLIHSAGRPPSGPASLSSRLSTALHGSWSPYLLFAPKHIYRGNGCKLYLVTTRHAILASPARHDRESYQCIHGHHVIHYRATRAPVGDCCRIGRGERRQALHRLERRGTRSETSRRSMRNYHKIGRCGKIVSPATSSYRPYWIPRWLTPLAEINASKLNANRPRHVPVEGFTDQDEDPCTMVMMCGYVSGLTVGRVNTIRSLVRVIAQGERGQMSKRRLPSCLMTPSRAPAWRLWIRCHRWQACRLAHGRRWHHGCVRVRLHYRVNAIRSSDPKGLFILLTCPILPPVSSSTDSSSVRLGTGSFLCPLNGTQSS